ncbi:MAG TPA: carboxypeptidase-like regulatory domain-containing protein, partial [Candidatus Dormibacteraeota bacterium]|nr:carboxypeptidase-like regulatory domain-containing protein [Candidatus Dormibacteraeota bacterium]
MYVLSRLFSPRGLGRRILIVAVIASALFFNTVGTLLAGTTGTISGTVTATTTNQGLSGVKVSAVSPTGHYSSTSDNKGFFSMTGVQPDTYTVSLELAGYQPVSITGVNVFPDQVADLTSSATLSKSLVTIG